MIEAQAAVRAFHEKFGFDVRDTPGIPSREILRLALRLIREEAQEVHSAAGFRVGESGWTTDHHTHHAPDVPKIAHELADLVYVALGMAVRCGIELAPVFEAVHAANMSKERSFREDGKLVKTDAYRAPDVAAILERQRPQ